MGTVSQLKRSDNGSQFGFVCPACASSASVPLKRTPRRHTPVVVSFTCEKCECKFTLSLRQTRDTAANQMACSVALNFMSDKGKAAIVAREQMIEASKALPAE